MDQIITGTDSPLVGMMPDLGDDITPFPSPAMGAIKRRFKSHRNTKLKGVIAYVFVFPLLSALPHPVGEEDFGELSIEDGLDEDKVVSEEDATQAQMLKTQANTAFSRKFSHIAFLLVPTDGLPFPFRLRTTLL